MRYTGVLKWRWSIAAMPFVVMGVLLLISLCLVPFLGQDFFPAVDSGQFRLHVRAPAGTRLESTEERFHKVGEAIRQVVPPAEIKTMLDNIGLPVSGINLAFSDSATIGEADGEILVSLEREPPSHGGLRAHAAHGAAPGNFRTWSSFSRAPDIVSQILNFGLPAPIDVQVTGRDPGNYAGGPGDRSGRSDKSRARWTCTCTRWSMGRTCG